MANTTGTTALSFSFSNQALSVLMIDGEPWFVASDVTDALTLSTEATRRLDDDEKGLRTVQTPGGQQEVIIINESGLYSLILTSRKPEAKKFKKWVTNEVLPSIRKTGGYTPPRQPITEATAALSFWDAAVKSLNIAPSGHLGGVRAIATSYGYDALLPHLPVYAIDAPPSTTGAAPTSSMPTASLTALMKDHGIKMGTAMANKMLARAGMLEEVTRPSSRGMVKKFWSVTEKGLKYGKNVTSPSNPKETQPHWYRHSFDELIHSHMTFSAMIGKAMP